MNIGQDAMDLVLFRSFCNSWGQESSKILDSLDEDGNGPGCARIRKTRQGCEKEGDLPASRRA
jgi:hypothetical protein